MKGRFGLTVSLFALQAASASLQATNIEEIVIKSQRLEETVPLDLSPYGNQLEIITGEQVQQHGFVDVTQTLQMMVPGLHIAPKHGPFDYFTASLQGSRKQDIL